MAIKIRSVDAGEFQGFVPVDENGNPISQSNRLPCVSKQDENTVDVVGVKAIIYEETATPLAANATFTSTARDCSGVATGTEFRGEYAALYKTTVYQDVTFTLAIEASNNGTEWYRIGSQTASSFGSGNFSAAFIYVPSFRYTRTVIINGASPSTKTIMSVILKSL